MAYPGTTFPGGHIPLKIVREDDRTWTFGWNTPSTAGYRFNSETDHSHTWDPTRRTVRFAKGSTWYRVEALDVSATGEIRPQAMPATYAGSASFAYGSTSFKTYAAGTAQYPAATTSPGAAAYPGLRSLHRTPSFGGTGSASYSSGASVSYGSDGTATYD